MVVWFLGLGKGLTLVRRLSGRMANKKRGFDFIDNGKQKSEFLRKI